jgi:predicted metal-dependent peptidase
MSIAQKLKIARAQFVLSDPFFAMLLLRMPLIESTSTKSMKTNSIVLEYNPEFIKSLTASELTGVLIHEVLHCVFLHFARQKERNLKRWNIACDYAINPVVLAAGYKLPSGVLFRNDLKDMSAEAIYNQLEKEDEKNQIRKKNGEPIIPANKKGGGNGKECDEDTWDIGGVFPYKGTQSGDELYQERAWKIATQEAAQVARAQGEMPRGIDRVIKNLLDPQLSWREILARFITENSRSDYMWSRPNRRYINRRVYLPMLNSPTLGTIVIMVDTSASIRQQELNSFGSEIGGVLLSYPSTNLRVMYIDSVVAHDEEVDIGSLDLHPKGGGGTNFKPGFRRLMEEGVEPSCVLYFTDGECDSYPKAPAYPVLWVLPSLRSSFRPPFGEVLRLKRGN